MKLTKQSLGWPLKPEFYIPKEAEQHFRKAIMDGKKAEKAWNDKLTAYKKKYPGLARNSINLSITN